MVSERSSAFVRLAGASARAQALEALAPKFAVTEGALDVHDAGWLNAGHAVAVLDYESEDARSVKLLQTATDRPNAPRLIQFSSVRRSSAESWGLSAGGMMPARTFFSAANQSFVSRRAAASSAKASRATPPFFAPRAWQP